MSLYDFVLFFQCQHSTVIGKRMDNHSGVLASLDDFIKTTSVIKYTTRRLAAVGDRIMRLARAEGFEAHARAVQMRLDSDKEG